MNSKNLVAKLMSGGGLLALLTLATGGLFKLAAFAHEAFIASHFGLSSVTDAYFAFQLLSVFTSSASLHAAATLLRLGCAFAPMICLGIWAGVAIANGRHVRAMFGAGLPYLLMIVLLVSLFAVGRLNDLSLPLSFLAGFGVVDLYALANLISKQCRHADWQTARFPWKLANFRRFLQQLGGSSLENAGFAANQFLLVFFLAKAGAGALSAPLVVWCSVVADGSVLLINLRNCMQRIGGALVEPHMVGAQEA